MKTFRNILSWVLPIIVALAVVFVVRTYLLEVVKVSGDSMEPNLRNGDAMIVTKPTPVKRLSVIVFDAYGEDPTAPKNTNYVKRVIGLPGDQVASKNGYLYVNHRKINQHFISQTEQGAGTGNWTLGGLAKQHNWSYQGNTVPRGHYFVLGDHRSVSEDGRAWGYVDAKKIMGVVKVPFWEGSSVHRANVNSLAG